MSGVVFVIHIPSKETEKKLRDSHRKQTDVSDVNEKNGENGVNFKESPKTVSEETTPLTTPEMQRNVMFSKEKERSYKSFECVDTLDGFSSDLGDTDSLKSDTTQYRKVLKLPDTLSKRSKSYDRLNAVSDQGSVIRKSWEGLKDIVGSAKKQKKSVETQSLHDENELGLAPDAFMVEIMEAILKYKNIRRTSWLETKSGHGIQIIFNLESGPRCDDTIRLLSEWGVGEREGTSVGVLPCTMYYEPIHDPLEKKPEEKITDTTKDGAWNTLISSVRARLNVADVVHEVKASAAITFDFLCLVIVASILAAFGLVEDSTLFLAASMLISPLMGPILAATFGTVIKDRSLQSMGVINEFIGIFMATLVGFIFGIIICSLDDRYGVGEGLTNEILSRCELHSLLVGILIALPSGAAVAISILGENTGSLVGTAISASLLPPAVNAGLLWALSCVYILFEKDGTRYNSVIKTNYYSNHQSIELAIFGCISMCVTLTNIICIYFMGILFLKIKEVSPVASRGHRQFWKHDIKIARDYNKTLHPNDSYTAALADELAHLKRHETEIHGVGAELLKKELAGNQNTWSPSLHHHHHHYMCQDKPHMRDLEAIYLSLACPTVTSNDSRFDPRRYRTQGPSKKSPSKLYKSIPDEEMLAPLNSGAPYPSEPINTPQSKDSHRIPSNSFPFVSRFMKQSSNANDHSNATHSKKKRFTVSPADDPLQPKPV
uniref:CSON006277 protein n=1 Tax=Culicoides sonorensis TaxID=179676 RepID=A0A336LZL7_CULSO